MDVLRSCYKTRARLYRDSSEETEIQWYFTESLPPLPVRHPFGSGNYYDRKWAADNLVGEIRGAARVWCDGAFPAGAKNPGGVVGTLPEFQSGASFAGPWTIPNSTFDAHWPGGAEVSYPYCPASGAWSHSARTFKNGVPSVALSHFLPGPYWNYSPFFGGILVFFTAEYSPLSPMVLTIFPDEDDDGAGRGEFVSFDCGPPLHYTYIYRDAGGPGIDTIWEIFIP